MDSYCQTYEIFKKNINFYINKNKLRSLFFFIFHDNETTIKNILIY